MARHKSDPSRAMERRGLKGSKLVHQGDGRFAAVIDTLTRVLLAPVFLAIWLITLPNRVVYKEPHKYGLCRWSEPVAQETVPVTATKPHKSLKLPPSESVPISASATFLQQPSPKHTRPVRGGGTSKLLHMQIPLWPPSGPTVQQQPGAAQSHARGSKIMDHAADGKIILQRFRESWKESVMLTVQGIIYYIVQHTLRMFAIDHLLWEFRQDLQCTIARLSGAVYTTRAGKAIPMSLMGALERDLHFTLPQSGARFPYGHPDQDPLGMDTCIFLCQASRLVYEDAEIIEDVVSRRWGMTFEGHRSVPAHNSRNCWVPDVVYFACSNQHSFVLTLKGADPLWQMGLAADPPTSKSPRPGMGEVHDGLWQGLQQPDPFWSNRTMYTTLLCLLRNAQQEGKGIYITGHSLGASLSTVFATTLAHREPELAACIKGLVTFASPRAGDAAFAARFDAAFGSVSQRFVHASDMVVMLPPKGLGFQHVGQLQHLASRPIDGSRLIKCSSAQRDEDRWAYINSLQRFSPSHTQRSTSFRTLVRLMMLPVPGFSDHLPTDYLYALQHEVELQQTS